MKTVDRLVEETGISARELAARARLDVARAQAIVDGRWTPSRAERERIAAAFGVSVTEISWGHTMNMRNVTYHRKGMKENF
jgi:ribosome-binding protein aMBF1 (putative translation factor)